MAATKESERLKNTRTSVIIYLSAFVALLGVPLFSYATLIHRARLPADEVAYKKAHFEEISYLNVPVHVHVPPYASADPSGLITLAQLQIDAFLALKNVHKSWRLVLDAIDDKGTASTPGYEAKFEETDGRNASPYSVSTTAKEITIYAPRGDTKTETLAASLSQALLQVFRDEIAAVEAILTDSHKADVVFPYAPTYNIVFNLFVEDGRPVKWQIEHAVEFIEPILRALGRYCSFKVSSQIQYYSKLHSEPLLNDDKTARVISQGDLSTFINYGEWNLNTHDIAPSINFLVFFPESNYNSVPLLVENSRTNSFLISQWGGVHIYNTKSVPENGHFELSGRDLEPVFDIFAAQLFELLGVPKGPESPVFRVDSFFRLATLKNLKRSSDNLAALIKLSNSLNGISIPEATSTNVKDSLAYFDKAVEKLKLGLFEESVAFAGRSVEKSDKAFFEKEMVQQAYFPNEHKLAVFLPLLGPICSIVLFGLLSYWKNRKNITAQEKEKKEN